MVSKSGKEDFQVRKGGTYNHIVERAIFKKSGK